MLTDLLLPPDLVFSALPTAALVADGRCMRALYLCPQGGEWDSPALYALRGTSAEAEGVGTGAAATVARLCAAVAEAGLPKPEQLRLAAPDALPGLFWDAAEATKAGPQKAFAASNAGFAAAVPETGLAVADLQHLFRYEAMEELRTGAIHGIPCPSVVPVSAACVLGLSALPALRRRGEREGMILAAGAGSRLTAVLFFQDRVWGVFSLPVAEVAGGLDLKALLDDFRLGWLPQELLRAVNAAGAVPTALPAEAAGFRPLYVTGPEAAPLAPLGRTARPGGGYDDSLLLGGLGLLV